MKKLTPYLGALGLGFVLAAGLLWVLQPASERYWLSFLTAGAILTAISAATRWRELGTSLRKRSAKAGANAIVLVVILVAMTGLVNYAADKNATQWDFTATSQYSLSDQTLKLLAELERAVTIVQLDRRSSPQVVATDLLKLYADASPLLDVVLIDPEAEPERAVTYTSPSAPVELGTILVEVDGRRQQVTSATESEVTNALIRAIKGDVKKIYFTSGHGEKVTTDESATGLSVVNDKLNGSAYQTETLNLARSVDSGATVVPDDAAVVVIAGPRSDFLDIELDALDAYLDRGGSVIFLVDPVNQADVSELTGFVVELGVVAGEDVVVDVLAQSPVYPVIQNYSSHPIVSSFGNAMSIFALARSITMAPVVPEGTEMLELFTTADQNSWAETDLEELTQRSSPKAGQRRGPIGLAMAATVDHGGERPDARFVVVGDSDFIANELAAAPIRNADLFLNMVNWTAQDEDLISIRPREPSERRVLMNDQQVRNVFFLSLIVLPGIVVVTGASLWWSRR